MLKKLSLILLTLFMVGCSTVKEKPVYITKQEYITYTLPKAMVGRCTANKPMDANEYLKLSDDAQEEYLANYVILLMGELKKCDGKVQSINNYINKYNDLIKEGSGNEREKRNSKKT